MIELINDPPVFETPLQEIISNQWHPSYTVWNAMTPAFDGTRIDYVRMGVWLDGPLEVLPGYQRSDDGETWGSYTTSGVYGSSQGWNWWSWIALTSPQPFIRFGVKCLDEVNGDTKNRTGQAKLCVQFRSTFAQTLKVGPRKVNTQGSTTTGCFFPMTGVVPTAGFDELRRTLELATSSGDIQLQAAYQITNTPDDESSWDAATTFGSTVSTETIDFSTTFSSASLTKKWARFGVLAKNVSGSDIEACRATLAVDRRFAG